MEGSYMNASNQCECLLAFGMIRERISSIGAYFPCYSPSFSLVSFWVNGQLIVLLDRDLEVPPALLSSVFPNLESAEDSWKSFKHLSRLKKDIAGPSFFRAMNSLRKVLVQDIAAMLASDCDVDCNLLMEHAPFSSDAFGDCVESMKPHLQRHRNCRYRAP